MQTECARLKSNGYEVFTPPYRISIPDQSAVVDWGYPDDSTLEPEIIEKLASTNFFYEPLSSEIGRILEAYFDLVIVTINQGWLHEILLVYDGPLIYRVFGQPYNLSRELTKNGTIKLITSRRDFWFCPHHEHTVQDEEPWLTQNMHIIPYCLSRDVVDLQDTWQFEKTASEIGLLCPRVKDSRYYNLNYKRLKHYFPQQNYKIFGVQMVETGDPRVHGTLERSEFLSRLQNTRGFVYHYTEPNVCYLPPIEFMMLGGPVVFQSGSLLSHYFPDADNAPGAASDIPELQQIASRVEAGDRALIQEIVDSQATVRALYHPDHVWPIFDKTIDDIINGKSPARYNDFIEVIPKAAKNASTVICVSETFELAEEKAQTILLPFHIFGPKIHICEGEFHCAEGIAKVVRMGVKALTSHGYKVVVTAGKSDIGKVHGFFHGVVDDPSLLKVLVTDHRFHQLIKRRKKNHAKMLIIMKFKGYRNFIIRKWIHVSTDIASYRLFRNFLMKFKGYRNFIIRKWIHVSTDITSYRLFEKFLVHCWGSLRFRLFGLSTNRSLQRYVEYTNNRPDIQTIWIPHFQHFDETIESTKQAILYLPDYLPHFYPNNRRMGATKQNALIGKLISNKSVAIFTNSQFTQNYLPDTELKVDQDKIRYFPLPNLGDTARARPNPLPTSFVQSLPDYYVIYPTRERPSKRLWDFIATVAKVNQMLSASGSKKRLYGILTAELKQSLPAPEVAPYIKTIDQVSDEKLRVLYKNATALLFTSELEGNFPTQLNEALNWGTPVIATKIPLIEDEIGEHSAALKLVEVGNVGGFAKRVIDCMEDRKAILREQKKTREFVCANFSYTQFEAGICELFDSVHTKILS